ncbi:FAD binding domain-containing protein [Sporosarcina sp. FSL W7-1283]|uniref:FAD binding domain-containing protein n=1 Tax=Sporosarcina sp. FSL W7-1283 TaxID=2921560 RepID=UPI0030F8F387
MIASDFKYFKPASVAELSKTFRDRQDQGDSTLFYSGGTEIITLSRVNQIQADSVIDIKGIAECNVLEVHEDKLLIGAAVSLNQITDSKLFPLLGDTLKQIADHTSRNKITIGGNMNSKLMYRESVLPLLLVDAKVKITKGNDEKIALLSSLFDKKMKLNPGEVLLQIIIDTSYIDLPYTSIKKTKISKVGYPVVTVAAIVKDKKIRLAFSGICDHPFRSSELEKIVNDSSLSIHKRIEKLIERLPSAIVDDIQATKGYRAFVLKNVLQDVMEEMEVAE